MPASSERPDVPSATPVGAPLPAREQRILAFERHWWKPAGAKEEAIRAELGLSAARYYQLLNAALDRPEAIAFDPLLVRRLQRLRNARTDARSARILGSSDRVTP
ncbi:MAG: DUF3263 domain-containing protein [Actinomycetota bacterium]